MPFAFTAIYSVVIVLSVMVFVHELGHFLVAKFFGVRVDVFSLGFGKRLLGFKYGETDYRLSLLPLGGYVKMAGEMGGDGSLNLETGEGAGDGDSSGNLNSKPRWQRILIGLAGPVANFALAFVLMTGLFMMHNEVPNFVNDQVTLDPVPANTPFSRAGLQAGDRILSFDGVKNPTYQQVVIHASVSSNSSVPVTVDRGGQSITTQVAIPNPGRQEDFSPEALGLMPWQQSTPIRIDKVEPGYPAADAGLQGGDVLASVDGQTFHAVGSLLNYLQQIGGRAVDVAVLRGGQTVHYTIKPIMADDGSGHAQYRLGFKPHPPPFHVEQLPVLQAAQASVKVNVENSGVIVTVLRRLFTQPSTARQLSSPIGIARETGEAVQEPGYQSIIGLMALISLNLGIFNLLPIPILDGGMICLLVVEGVLRRDLNQEFKERIYQVAFVALILFFAFVVFNDVSKLSIFSKLKP